MKTALLASVVISSLAIAGMAAAADLPLKGPIVPPAVPFTWTSCYAGGHVGGGWASKNFTDPVELVQDQLSGAPVTVGVTTVAVDPTGFVGGGQAGCDYQFASGWVAGILGTVSGTTLQTSRTVALPLGVPGDRETVRARVDIVPSATARFGYGWGPWLVYGDGGVAWVGDRNDISGTFQGTAFDFQGQDLRSGWTVGAGIEWALWRYWSVILKYDYYDFGHHHVLMLDNPLALSGPVDVKQSLQTIKLGVNFHVWAWDRW